MTESVSILAPAKINLSLAIGKRKFRNPLRKGDFFHKVDGVFLKIPLSDEIRVKKTSGGKIRLSLSGVFAGSIPNNDENIVYRAAHSLFSMIGFSPGIEITLKKNIPPQSGLGGGSSDGAHVLKALRTLFPEKTNPLNPDEWMKLLLTLGSDVPFFFSEETMARVSSFGEQVIPIRHEKMKSQAVIVAMLPRIFASTEWAYRELDEYRKSGKILLASNNDFEAPIFSRFPDLKELKDDLLSLGAEEAGLTGSGSSMYALFQSYSSAEKATQKIKKRCSFCELGKLG